MANPGAVGKAQPAASHTQHDCDRVLCHHPDLLSVEVQVSLEVSYLLVGFAVGFLLALSIAAVMVHNLVQKHRAVLAAHGISHDKRASQVITPNRR